MRLPRSAFVLLLLALPATADVLVLANGRPLRGGVHRDDPAGVSWNPYFSRHPGMVFDTQEFLREQVKEVIREEPPFREFLRRMREVPKGDVTALVEVARWAESEKLAEEARFALLEALRIDPANEEALREFGKSKFPKVARGDPDFDPDLRAQVEEYLKLEDAAERAALYGKMKRERFIVWPQEYLDRIRRSAGEPKGLQKDRALTMGAAQSPGVYTLFVPEGYDPRRPWPLLVGLHGGGVGGREGDAVVGSGHSAMNFYVREAAARGYIVVCPTARAAPWASGMNGPFLESVIAEVELLYHVDLNRVYLTGHSMGGFGCWHYGPQWAERFAAISPMAGGGGGGWNRLVETNTPVFIFHGADDNVVGPDSDRSAARALAKTAHDFVYTELTGVGHGFPDSIQKDLFDFFDGRRLAPVRGKRAGPPGPEPASSFLAKVSREEKLYLGDPLTFGDGEEGGVKQLIKELKLGGGRAEAAATKLGELRDEASVKPVADLLRHPATADDVRVQAARALGLIGHPDALPALSAGLVSERHDVFCACAFALARIRSEKAGPALIESFAHLDRVLDGKRIGGIRIDYSDWELWLSAYRAVVEALAVAKPPGAVAAMTRSPVKKVIAGGLEVIASPRAGEDPAVPRRALALAIVAAVETIRDPAGVACLTALKDAWPGDPAIITACDRVLNGLR
ncbi:MAG: HEAT repeat domain-containing protein [Planctomycetes bacterium]|nr:HEAT repeat domain-containing protein [Planctomycetota bacterium]